MSRFTSGAQPQGSAEGAVSVAGAIVGLGSGWERAGCGSRSDRDLLWDRMFSRQGLLAEGCEGVGTGRERALGVRSCSARAAPRFNPPPPGLDPRQKLKPRYIYHLSVLLPLSWEEAGVGDPFHSHRTYEVERVGPQCPEEWA